MNHRGCIAENQAAKFTGSGPLKQVIEPGGRADGVWWRLTAGGASLRFQDISGTGTYEQTD
jgi:hypothetical protein